MNKILDIGLLLDVCGITYNTEQIEKLQRLIEDVGGCNCVSAEAKCESEEDVLALVKEEPEENHSNAEFPPDLLLEDHGQPSFDWDPGLDMKSELGVAVKKFGCAHCDEICADRKSLDFHVKDLHNVKPVQCDKCHKSFASVRAMARHAQSQTCRQNDPTVPNLCQHCGKVFDTHEQLRTHFRYNHKERPESCGICHHKFHSIRDLKRHVSSVHEGRKDVQCQECGKFFACSNTLATHVRCVHLKLRPYKCQLCQKAFTLLDTLKKHRLWAHSNTRPFGCDQCGKAFAIKNQLNNHVKVVHEKIKRYECSTCQMRFGQKTTLEKHTARIHDKKRHICSECGKIFSWTGALKTHLKKVHS
jgi:KRAB domain-containing zinc finger protein